MRKVIPIGHFSEKKEKIRFVTDLEKKFHKIISGMRYGQSIDIETDVKTDEEQLEVFKAVKKSAFYNNIDIKHRWAADRTYITLTVDGY